MVERRDDASDRRARTLHLTAQGEACATQLEEALVPFRRSLFDHIAPSIPENAFAPSILIVLGGWR